MPLLNLKRVTSLFVERTGHGNEFRPKSNQFREEDLEARLTFAKNLYFDRDQMAGTAALWEDVALRHPLKRMFSVGIGAKYSNDRFSSERRDTFVSGSRLV